MMEIDLSKLNTFQREAVIHDTGPLLILAGAGSGKTSTMSYRVAYLIAHRGVRPFQILGLSFTNKAALELRQRVKGLVSTDVRGLFISTFHSLCVRLLKKFADRLQYGLNFTILDEYDQGDVLRQILKNIKFDKKAVNTKLILYFFSQAKNQFFTLEQAIEYFQSIKGQSDEFIYILMDTYAKYQQHLKALNAMDFDDLLYNTATLLSKDTEVLEKVQNHFLHILVDEYQDTNSAQFEILKMIAARHQNLVVVGDDDQSIYSWRGGNPEHILGFSEIYPTAKCITLEQNYRSTQSILAAANAVIANNKNRFKKNLWSDKLGDDKIQYFITEDDQAEANLVAEKILELKKIYSCHWAAFAVLYRSNTQSRIFEQTFRSVSIPYKLIGGMSFLDRKEVKDCLALLKIIINVRDDVAFRRIINWPSRGIGSVTLEKLTQLSIVSQKSIYEVCCEPHLLVDIPHATQGAILEFIQKLKIHQIKLSEVQDVDQAMRWMQELFVDFEVKKGIEQDAADPAAFARKWDNAQELMHAAGQFARMLSTFQAKNWLQDFCARMMLHQTEDSEQEMKDQVTLLTLHGAKGLEYDFVFLVGLEDGLLPHQRSIDEAQDLSEERRLCYVGITRAKRKLFLTRAQHRIRYGKKVPKHPSRFLKEIPESLLDKQDAGEEKSSFLSDYIQHFESLLNKKKH